MPTGDGSACSAAEQIADGLDDDVGGEDEEAAGDQAQREPIGSQPLVIELPEDNTGSNDPDPRGDAEPGEGDGVGEDPGGEGRDACRQLPGDGAHGDAYGSSLHERLVMIIATLTCQLTCSPP